jgi:hypothetical protein
MFTILCIFWSIEGWSSLHEGPDASSSDRETQYKRLLSNHGFKEQPTISFLEGHLNVLDSKNQSMLGFGVNYFLLVATVYFLMLSLQTEGNHIWLAAPCLVLIAAGMFHSFRNVNQVQWQDYAKNNTEVCKQLLEARHQRTVAFRRSKLFYIYSFGLFVDSVLVEVALRALGYMPQAH